MSEISVTVNGSTTINPTVGNGDVVNVTISTVGERGPTGSTGSAGPANTLSIGTVSQGTAAATITGTAPNQVLNLVLQKGDAGTAIELQANSTHIQWRLVGASSWTNLVELAAITGPTGSTGAAGTPVELQATSTHLQWRYVGGSTWTNVLALSTLVGAQGPQGPAGPAGPPINLTDETPQPLGVASAGTALAAARADHVHAVGSVTYSSLSGIPSTFTPSAHQHAVSDVTGLQAALDGKQAAGAYAPLVNSLIPSSFLPSYVDDVVDVGGTLPASGDVGKIYVVSTGANTNKIYRWSGSTFIEISPSPGSTDSVTEGSTNLYHTTQRAAAASPVQSVAGRTGTITLAQLGSSGTASSTTFLRGDGAWSAAGSTDASLLTSGTVAAARLPLATTTAAGAVIVGSGLSITDGVLAASGGGGSGVVAVANIAALPATGTANAIYLALNIGRFLRWDADAAVYVELGPEGVDDPAYLGVVARYLLVGGGGAGGGCAGGGGGAGAVATATDLALSRNVKYTVVIGSGGTGTTGNGGNGGGSSFYGPGVTLVANGGGGGGGVRSSEAAGAQGASGGGAGGGHPDGAGQMQGGIGTAGFAGGNSGSSPSSCVRTGGGGGGSSSVGGNAAGYVAGSGGAGTSSNIGGGSVLVAGGGGGGAMDGSANAGGGCPTHTAGLGVAGGGNGNNSNSGGIPGNGQAALPNTGSGGGGGAFSGSSEWLGGNGGSGLFIIRTSVEAAATTGSPTVTTVSGQIVYTFTQSGTITF